MTRVPIGIDECLRVLVYEIYAKAAHFKSQIEESTPREEREDRVAHAHCTILQSEANLPEFVRAKS